MLAKFGGRSRTAHTITMTTSEVPTFQFTLLVDGPDIQGEDYLDALFEAGCDDALVGSTDGVQYLDFDREADSLSNAIMSAISDVETITGVEVVRIADAGLISMAEIAERTGRTRESVRLLVAGERGPGGFPPPVTDPRNRYRLWRPADVDSWFSANLDTPTGSSDDEVLSAINAALELRRYRRSTAEIEAKDLRTLIGL